MESFLPSEIARLVLGYLEEHKCDEAYETFLHSSPNLEECLKMKEEGRIFRTQVLGLNLVDILSEYSAIDSLVQNQLKKIDEETAARLKNCGSLLDKLKCLLNSTSSKQTMLLSITVPTGKSPQKSAAAHVRKHLKLTSSERKRDHKKQGHIRSDSSVSCPELSESGMNHSNLETTSLTSLPGSSSFNCMSALANSHGSTPLKTQKKRGYFSYPKRLGDTEGNEDNLSIITRVLLDDHQLHEKIAENINKVICTPESNAKKTRILSQDVSNEQNQKKADISTASNSFSVELDNAIKKIVQETESDPLFENFLCNIMGSASEETSDDYDDRITNEDSAYNESQPETTEEKSLTKERSQNVSVDCSSPAKSNSNTSSKIDDQNAAAIQSIIQMNSVEKTENKSNVENDDISEVCTDKSQIKENNDSTIVPIVTVTNSVVTTTVTTAATVSTETKLTSADNLTEAEKLNKMNSKQELKTGLVPLRPDTNQQNLLINNNNLLTSQENIVKMQNSFMLSQSNVLQPQTTLVISNPFTTVYQQPSVPDERLIVLNNKIGAIGPQIMALKSTSLQVAPPTAITEHDILAMPTVIVCEDRQSAALLPTQSLQYPIVSNVIKKSLPAKIKPKLLVDMGPTTEHKSSEMLDHCQEKGLLKYKITVEPQQVVEQSQSSTENYKSVSVISTSPDNDKIVERTEKTVTPQEPQTKIVSTPRNTRSHVRALDFSTPPKEESSGKKISSSPKLSKTPRSAKIRANLFMSPDNSAAPIATRSPMVKLSGDWDRVQGAELIFRGNRSAEKSSESDTKSPAPDKITAVPVSRPRRDVVSRFQRKVEPPKSKVKAAKKSPRKDKNLWDADLRVHVEPVVVQDKVKRPREKRKYTRRVKPNPLLNKTEGDGASIEVQLAAMEGVQLDTDSKEIQPEPGVSDKCEKKTSKVKNVKGAKSAPQKPQITKSKECEETDMKKDEETTHDQPDTSIVNVDSNKEIKEGLRTMIPRINRKCNIGNAAKTIINKDEYSVKNITDGKTVAPLTSAKNMTILSPSKMNANKRTLEMGEAMKEIANITNNESVCIVEATATSTDITSEMKIKSDVPRAIAKSNVTSDLETPIKNNSLLFPITPKLCTPLFESSFLKMCKDNFGSVDLSSIPTPSIPVTPSITLTPFGPDGSSYESRPTDYSNSSSYYQPSDSEQNQKLEKALIEECMKIEANKLNEKNKSSHKQLATTKQQPKSNYILYKIDLSPDKEKTKMVNENYKNKKHDDNLLTDQDNSCTNQHKRENNNLDSSKDSTSSGSSSYSSSCDSSDSDSSSSDDKEQVNATVIHATKTDNSTSNSSHRYSLRKHKALPSHDQTKEVHKTDSIHSENVQSATSKRNKSTDVKLEDTESCKNKTRGISKVKKTHAGLLTELKTKLNRTINEIKSETSIEKKKVKVKPTRKRLNKHLGRPLSKNLKKFDAESDDKNKSESIVKNVLPAVQKMDSKLSKVEDVELIKEVSVLPQQIAYNAASCSEKDIGEEEIPHLHISSDEDLTSDIALRKIPESDNILIKKLKERGIHLIPKKVTQVKIRKLSSSREDGEINTDEVTSVTNQNKTISKECANKIKIHSDVRLDTTKKIDISKINLSQAIKTNTIIGASLKGSVQSPNANNDDQQKSQDLENINKVTSNVNNENSNSKCPPIINESNSEDVEFGIKVITENSPEYFKIDHDYTKPLQKKLSDYNLNLLRKEITAKVFLEEDNIEQEKVLTVTPLFNILTINSSKKKAPGLRKYIERNTDMQKQTMKPLNVLYNQLVDDSSSTDESPNEKRFTECTNTSDKSISNTSDKSIEKSEATKSIGNTQTQNMKERLKLKSKPEEIGEHGGNLTKNETSVTVSNVAKNVISLEQYKNKHGKREQNINQEENRDDIDCEDYLMTYAITVGAKPQTSQLPQDTSSKKRKAPCDTDNIKQTTEKRMKPNDTQALLRKYGLDTLLTKVHGPSN